MGKRKNIKNEEVKVNRISGVQIIQYFIIYSIIGLVIEMLFGLLIDGVVASRKNFLYGPFSCIYGVGGIFMTVILNEYKDNKYKLFVGGMIIGIIIEYCISLFGELIFQVKWWDYSGLPFNIQGRVCLLFAIIWGFLAVWSITYVNNKIDKILAKINQNFLRIFSIVLMILLIINYFVTSFALQVFYARLVSDLDIELKSEVTIVQRYEEWCKNDIFKNVTDTLFSNEKMLKTFPNLLITLKNGKVIYVRTLLPEIEPYYFRVYTPPLDIDLPFLNFKK